jgi:hypothetical protein
VEIILHSISPLLPSTFEDEMRRITKFAVVIGGVLVCLSCKKDKDGTPPEVDILSPSAGSTFAIPDTIHVRVQVSDDRIIESLTVELLNPAGSVVASGGSRSVDAVSGTYDFTLILTDERQPGGDHTIVARARDGANDARDFVEVNVLEAPLRLRALFLAPPFSEESTTITRIDSTGESSPFITVADFNGIAVDANSQHLFVAGSRYAPLQAIPTANSANGWQVNAPGSDQPEQFTALVVDPADKRVYYATRDGFIRGWTGEGLQRFTAECLPDHRCEAIVVMENEVATWQRAIVGGASRIVTYTPAGTVFEQLPVEHERIALFHRTGSSLLHFANAGGEGLIEDINISAGGAPDIRAFPGEAIRAVVRLNTNQYILALTDRLVRFDRPLQTVTTLASGVSADALAYEAATGSLYVATGTTLLTMDPNTGTTVSSSSPGFTIGHILPLLNR